MCSFEPLVGDDENQSSAVLLDEVFVFARYIGQSNLSPFIAILCHFRAEFPLNASKAIQLLVCCLLPSAQTLSTSWLSCSFFLILALRPTGLETP